MKENKRRTEQLKEISRARISANLAKNYGINYNTGNYLVPENRKDEVYVDESLRKTHIGYDMINDDLNELVAVPETIIKVKRKPSKRTIIKRKLFQAALGLSFMYALISLEIKAVKGLQYLGNERRLDTITLSSTTALAEVVEEATNKVGDEIVGIKYDVIAKYIENSENPDFELFTLYRNYDRENGDGTREYRDLAEKVTRELTFLDKDGNEKHLGFKDYVSGSYCGNQTKSELYDRYYEDCSRELLYGDDEILDQLPYTVKKPSKKLGLK